MTLAGFRAQNHPQQIGKRGASAAIDDRAITDADFAPLHERFRFTIDAAASATNAKLERYWTAEDDALKQNWDSERVWCNPPYSNIEPWIDYAHWQFQIRHCELIVMLLPANRTEQGWWQRCVERYRIGAKPGMSYPPRWDPDFHVEFLPGRMRFDRPGAVIGPKGDRPPFGCCLAIWGNP